ncbi:MAG: histidinol-phosphate transaminase [Burkholderiaceae bacterium]
MNPFWSPVVGQLAPYIPGEQPQVDGLIKLNTNENPYPPSPRVVEAIRAVLGADGNRLRLYPDPHSAELRAAAAGLYGLTADHVFAGNGSDEVLAFVFQGLLHHSEPVVFPDITYSFYPSYCRLYGLTHTTLALTDDFEIELAAVPRSARALIFPNPNAPTGRVLARSAIEQFLTERPETLVVVDEAYVDFGAESCAPLVASHANLLVTQSLSKSRALAGLRVGLAFGQPGLLEALIRIKDSFNSYPLDRLAGAAAVAAMTDTDWLERNRQTVMRSRDWLTQQLTKLGFEVLPSMANFVYARHPEREAAVLADGLRARKILVRHFDKPRIHDRLRITVGTQPQCEALVDALAALTNNDPAR